MKEVNEKLAEHNTKIELPLIGRQQPFVSTIKLDDKKRGKPILVFASFCPFCGEKYPSEEVAACVGLGRNDCEVCGQREGVHDAVFDGWVCTECSSGWEPTRNLGSPE
ncbi:hypothetical protein ACRQ5Q_24470 [Bradyrhizobium sp. PMVTL-01]|uniref:hypothetical protein n=1 Tax=Bradyrhizobium sp. PMVTL-01 TaxID=3434999 RepID=UPI003F702F9C